MPLSFFWKIEVGMFWNRVGTFGLIACMNGAFACACACACAFRGEAGWRGEIRDVPRDWERACVLRVVFAVY